VDAALSYAPLLDALLLDALFHPELPLPLSLPLSEELLPPKSEFPLPNLLALEE